MSGNRISTFPTSPSGGGGIDYDQLAAAVLKMSGMEGLRRVDAKLLGAEVAGVGVEPVTAGGCGRVETVVGSVPVLSGGGGGASAGAVGYEVPVGFGVVPASEDGVDEGDGLSVHSVSSGASVSGGVPGRVTSVVREQVQFGGMGSVYRDAVEVVGVKQPGYFALTAKRAQAVALKKRIFDVSGVVVPKRAMVELGMCTYTTGVMPNLVADGSRRLRSLAAIGDAAVTLYLTLRAYGNGAAVSSAQSLRSQVTSNANFRAVMKSKGFLEHVTFAAGVDPEVTTATATAFEAIVGVLAMHTGTNDVAKFLQSTGVVV